MTNPKPNSPNSKAPRHPPWYVSIIFVIAVLIGLWILVVTTEGHLNRGHWVLMYLSAGLAAGVAFWTLTPGANAELSVPHLGIKLFGGAAIGGAFMLLAWWLSFPTARYSVYDAPSIPGSVKRWIPQNSRVVELPEDRVLIDFPTDKDSVFVTITYQLRGTGSIVERRYRFDRSGKVQEVIQ